MIMIMIMINYDALNRGNNNPLVKGTILTAGQARMSICVWSLHADIAHSHQV